MLTPRRTSGHRPSYEPPPAGPTRAGLEESLPPGYRLRGDEDFLILLGPDGSMVAAFSAQGADPLEVFAEAWEDYE